MWISKLKNLTLHISVTLETDVKLKTRKVSVRKETQLSRGNAVPFLAHKFIYNTGSFSKPSYLPPSKSRDKLSMTAVTNAQSSILGLNTGYPD
jgi:hypothetical protein